MSNDDEIDAVFKALANRTRREMCDLLKARPMTTGQLAEALPRIDRTTVMMHLRVLEAAGLVVAVRKGRERFNHLNAMPIQAIHQRWIGPHAAAAASGLASLKARLEAEDAVNTGQ
jgi:DNA-binding transcriptional ArsR family regulator